jgi:hypothetical protein
LQNPMQSRDIAKDIAMLRKSAETLKSWIVGIPADKLWGESSKNELLEWFKSLMPWYDTYAVIKNKGLDFSQYTLEDAAKIWLDVLSIIPAVKLLSVGLKVVKVIKVTNAISNWSRLAKAYNIGNITSEVWSVLIEWGWAIKDVIDKFNEYQKNKNNEELFNIIKTLGIVVISATTSNYLIDTKKMEKLWFPKEFIIRVVDWFGVSGVREAYLKHWKNIP